MDIKIVGIFREKESKTIHRFGIKNDRLYHSTTTFMRGTTDWAIVDTTQRINLYKSTSLWTHIVNYQNLISRDIKLRNILGET